MIEDEEEGEDRETIETEIEDHVIESAIVIETDEDEEDPTVTTKPHPMKKTTGTTTIQKRPIRSTL